MALLQEFKNEWNAQVHTDAQKAIAADFCHKVLLCAKMASVQMGMGHFSDAGAHGEKAEERFFSANHKPHRFYRASAGSTIERAVYKHLIQGFDADEVGKNVYRSSTGVIFALEFTKSIPNVFSSSFSNSRPDIRVSLGIGTDGNAYEILIDLTSEKQKAHILKKGDNWLAKKYVPYIAEILWTDDDIMHKLNQ